MSTDANALIVRRYFEELFTRGDLARADEILAPDAILREPGRVIEGLEALKRRLAQFRTAFPDVSCLPDDLVTAGDTVAARYTLRGTHRGTFAGVAPTGAAVAAEGIIIFRLSGGRITEGWGSFDALGLMVQLGATLTFPGPMEA